MWSSSVAPLKGKILEPLTGHLTRLMRGVTSTVEYEVDRSLTKIPAQEDLGRLPHCRAFITQARALISTSLGNSILNYHFNDFIHLGVKGSKRVSRENSSTE